MLDDCESEESSESEAILTAFLYFLLHRLYLYFLRVNFGFLLNVSFAGGAMCQLVADGWQFHLGQNNLH